MIKDKRFDSFFPSADKIFKVNNQLGIAVYRNKTIVFIYTVEYFNTRTGKRNYPPTIKECQKVWEITDSSRTMILPLLAGTYRGSSILTSIGSQVAGRFKKTKDKIFYELDDIRYPIPYGIPINFKDSIPQGISGTQIKRTGPRPRLEKNSNW